MLSILEHEFMQRALCAGLLASVACGVIGSYVVVKRITFIGGGISHASLGGIGLAMWLGIAPLYGAVAFSLVSAVIIGLASLYQREQEDTLISALWAIGMAIGVVFINMTPGYASDLSSYLFGSIQLVSRQDVIMAAVLDVLILSLVCFFYKEFLAVSLDDEFAALRGVPLTFIYLLLLCLVALTVVVEIQVVGVILVIALLTLPPAMSRWFTRRLHQMMLASCLLGAVFTISGLTVSYYTDLAPGACIILTAGTVYALASLPRQMLWRPQG